MRSAGSTAVGGVLSLELMCPGVSGPKGAAIAGTGTVVALPGFARHLTVNSPVRGGETLTFEVEGQPGELPLLLVSFVHEPIPLLNGSLLVGLPPTGVFVLPPLRASGQATLAFPVPNVGAGVESLSFYAQAAFLDPAPRIWLGAGATVVLLDGSFWSATTRGGRVPRPNPFAWRRLEAPRRRRLPTGAQQPDAQVAESTL